MNIIEKIQYLQKKRNWTVYTLSLESGLNQSTIATMFQRNTPPKLETLQAICDAFGITLSQFFLESENMEVVSETEKELLSLYRNLPQDKKVALLNLIKN